MVGKVEFIKIRKVEFIKSLGAKLTNPQSWNARMVADGSVVFIVKEEDATKQTLDKGLEWRILKDKHPSNKGNGWKERVRHIQEIRQKDLGAYLVVGTRNASGFTGFDRNLYSVRLETRGSDVYAVSVGLNSAPTQTSDVDYDPQLEQGDFDRDTEKSQSILARRGQGWFRGRLEKIESCCRLTGVRDRAHLRASHIKPWKDSTDRERLDGNNGLLLAPHI
jgi:hypothetical protein